MRGAIEPEQDLVQQTTDAIHQHLHELCKGAAVPIQPESLPASDVDTPSPSATDTPVPLSIHTKEGLYTLHAVVARRSARLEAKQAGLRKVTQQILHHDTTVHRRIPAQVEEHGTDVFDADAHWQPSQRERSPTLAPDSVAASRPDLAQKRAQLVRQYEQFEEECRALERRLTEARLQLDCAKKQHLRVQKEKIETQKQASARVIANEKYIVEQLDAARVAQESQAQQKETRARAHILKANLAARQEYDAKRANQRLAFLNSIRAPPKKAIDLSRHNGKAVQVTRDRPHPGKRPT